MIHLKQAVVVEGRYDKAHLASLLDTVIIETGGFRIFKDREKLAMLREIARRRGLVILTDSDAAGFRIRRYLGGSIPKENLYHAYIPDIYGKERRKERPSAEGKLGVEGVSAQVILEALERAGVLTDTTPEPARRITKTDFIDWGLSGGTNSTARRDRIKGLFTYQSILRPTRSSMYSIRSMAMNRFVRCCRSFSERMLLSLHADPGKSLRKGANQ